VKAFGRAGRILAERQAEAVALGGEIMAMLTGYQAAATADLIDACGADPVEAAVSAAESYTGLLADAAQIIEESAHAR